MYSRFRIKIANKIIVVKSPFRFDFYVRHYVAFNPETDKTKLAPGTLYRLRLFPRVEYVPVRFLYQRNHGNRNCGPVA